MPELTTPTPMGANKLNNRVIMAPLTRNRANADGVPGELAATYYKQRASAGLIITEATQISPTGKGYLDTPGIHSDSQIEAWKKVTDAVHGEGGKIFVQLWHVGRVSHNSLLPEGEIPVAPSAIRAETKTYTQQGFTDVSEPRELGLDEIPAIIDDYRQAAENAIKAGFDGVEIHAANGYLIDQFLRDQSNTRTDAYGGSIENRMRFLVEVVEAVTGAIGADKTGIRLSPVAEVNGIGDSDPLTHFTPVIERLNGFGLAYLHFVERFPGTPPNETSENTVKVLRDLWKGFYIANGEYGRDEAVASLTDGTADAVAFGRPFISNPDLPARLASNAPLNGLNQDTLYGGGAEGYIDYPALETETA